MIVRQCWDPTRHKGRATRTAALAARAASAGAMFLMAGWLLPGGAAATMRVGVAIHAGYNSYAMTDVNDEVIDPINILLAGSGYSMDEISGGWGFGGGIRVRPSGPLAIALDYERLTGGSDLSLFGSGFEVDTPANAFTGTVTYYFRSSSRARFGIGAGFGYYVSAGSAHSDSAGVTTDTADLEGDGLGVHGGLALDAAISPNVHFEGIAGYRYAKTKDLDLVRSVMGVEYHEKLYTSDGDEAKLDWSGFMSRVGLTFYFGAAPETTTPSGTGTSP